jgi:hypothetical protein
MEKTTKVLESSLLYRKIDELGLTPRATAEAIAALEAADRLTSALIWAMAKLNLAGTALFGRATLKHQ